MSIDFRKLARSIDSTKELQQEMAKLGSDEKQERLYKTYEKINEKDEGPVKDLWVCEICETEFFLERNKKPQECPEDQGGCGKFRTKTVFNAKTGPYKYFTFNPHPRFRPKLLADDILDEEYYLTMKDSKDMYVFKNGIYKREGETHIKEKAQRKLGIESESKKKNKTVDYIESETYTERDKLNDSNLIAVENGILDVETRSIFEPDPEEHYITMRLPVEYDEDADCEMINSFLHEIVRDEDVKVLQELAGYCLWKEYPIAKAFMLHGSGANGKSTFLRLLERFLGCENVANPSLQGLLNDKFTSADLYGKLACIHADIPSDKLEGTGKFKMLTGGDTIRARRIYQDKFEFNNFAKMIFSANELPYTKDTTDAFFRRWIIVDFPYQFKESDPKTDPNILEKITTKDELSGFLNWALDGLDRILAQGHFSHSSNMDDIKRKWIMMTDTFHAFMESEIEETPEGMIPKEELPTIEKGKPDNFYKAYKDFCNKNDQTSQKPGTITRRLKSSVTLLQKSRPTIDGERVRLWEGIKFKDSSDYSYLNISEDDFGEEEDENQSNLDVVNEKQ